MLALLDQRLHPFHHVIGLGAQHAREFAHAGVLLGQVFARAVGGERLDAAHAGGARRLRHDLDQADIAGARRVRTAAQLNRPGFVGSLSLPASSGRTWAGVTDTHGDDAHLVTVLLAEQRHGAALLGLLHAHQARFYRAVLEHERVGHCLDGPNFLGRHGLGVGEIETQPLRVHQRTLLGHVRTQHLPQRLMRKMGGGMVGTRGRTTPVIDDQFYGIAGFEGAGFDAADMDEHIAQFFLCVRDAEQPTLGTLDDALVADLSAGLAIKRRLIEHNRGFFAGFEALHLLAVLENGADLAFGGFRVVAEEIGGPRRAP